MPQTTVHMANVIPKIDNASPWGFSWEIFIYVLCVVSGNVAEQSILMLPSQNEYNISRQSKEIWSMNIPWTVSLAQ